QRQAAARDAATALRLVVRAMLLSPAFLFRFEVGSDGAGPGQPTRLTPFERASALSYFLTDGPPDAELMSAARAGGLETREQIAAQARRLLRSPDTGGGVLAFLTERLRLDEVRGIDKDPKKFPQWSAELSAAMAEEGRLFLRQVLWKDGA